MRLRLLGVLVGVFLGALVSSGVMMRSAAAQDPALLAIGAGVFDFDDDETAGAVSAEYLFSDRLWLLRPLAGVMATFDGAVYAYGGFGLDLVFGGRWAVTPSLAAGLYGEGGGKDLGSVVEFRSGVQIAYRFDDDSRLGLLFHHISNAGLDDRNPGANTLMLTYSIPIGAAGAK